MSDSERSSGNQYFQTTRWSVVLQAQGDSSETASDWKDSLETLCQDYWYPLYAYLRRRGYGPEDAADLTQGFFAALIEKEYLKSVDPDRGRFRWFLMDAVAKYAANWNASQKTQKRGGHRRHFSLDFHEGEARYRLEPIESETPEALYERRWALTLLQRALVKLHTEYEAQGKSEHFECLRVFLTPGGPMPAHKEVAQQLGLSETAVKVAIHRLREKYRRSIRQLVADTISDPATLDDEINDLITAMTGPAS